MAKKSIHCPKCRKVHSFFIAEPPVLQTRGESPGNPWVVTACDDCKTTFEYYGFGSSTQTREHVPAVAPSSDPS